ncbi:MULTISPECIES: flagellar protein FlaG [unclassified Exiguobacterium]|uniref:flagellar protein FlaG n=1 Tax=unclassified Exiguobacterium TaxID=2644629 RepID=UPI001BEAD449|nr:MULTISPECIES: flagellar protein FlaG [unclassified Exiguobacterium]
MNSINTEIRLHLPANVLSYEATRNVFVEANQEELEQDVVVVLPTSQHVTKLETAIEKANSQLEIQRTGLKFVKHEKLNEFYIQIVDMNDNVVQEIPSKKELDFFAAFMEFNQLIDKRV